MQCSQIIIEHVWGMQRGACYGERTTVIPTALTLNHPDPQQWLDSKARNWAASFFRSLWSLTSGLTPSGQGLEPWGPFGVEPDRCDSAGWAKNSC